MIPMSQSESPSAPVDAPPPPAVLRVLVDNHRQFLAFLEDLEPLEIVPVGGKEIASASAWLRRFSDQPLTLTDAFGLELIKRNRIRTCWSTDRHLTLGGASLVIHE